jgi:hypothetical protein
MIVRIQQFPVQDAERLGGWPWHGPAGPIRYDWPSDTSAFELAVRESNEWGKPIPASERRDHLKSVIPTLLHILKTSEESIVLRFDGPLADGELIGLFNHLTDYEGYGRFSISAIDKLDATPSISMGSIRIEMQFDRILALCSDPGVNLESSVRLRAFAVPEELVNPLLDTAALDDERWPQIIPHAGFILQPTGGMDAVHVLTSRFTPKEFSERVTRGLAGE